MRHHPGGFAIRRRLILRCGFRLGGNWSRRWDLLGSNDLSARLASFASGIRRRVVANRIDVAISATASFRATSPRSARPTWRAAGEETTIHAFTILRPAAQLRAAALPRPITAATAIHHWHRQTQSPGAANAATAAVIAIEVARLTLAGRIAPPFVPVKATAAAAGETTCPWKPSATAGAAARATATSAARQLTLRRTGLAVGHAGLHAAHVLRIAARTAIEAVIAAGVMPVERFDAGHPQAGSTAAAAGQRESVSRDQPQK